MFCEIVTLNEHPGPKALNQGIHDSLRLLCGIDGNVTAGDVAVIVGGTGSGCCDCKPWSAKLQVSVPVTRENVIEHEIGGANAP